MRRDNLVVRALLEYERAYEIVVNDQKLTECIRRLGRLATVRPMDVDAVDAADAELGALMAERTRLGGWPARLRGAS